MTGEGSTDPASSARPAERRRRRNRATRWSASAALVFLGAAATIRVGDPDARESGPVVVVPVVVTAPLRLQGALVRGAARDWATTGGRLTRSGDPLPVELTAYCLRGRTRRDRTVREGIVAADPKLFPLGRYVELYVGRSYVGRFLIDDTGERIKGGIFDIWTPECGVARRFGRRRGTAVLVPRVRGARPDTMMTGRLDRPAER